MLLRSTLLYAPAIFITRISALLLIIIATRLIDQTEYGLLTLVVTIGEMTDVAVSNWLRISLLRLGGKGEISRGSVGLAARVLVLTTLGGLLIGTLVSILLVPERWGEFALAVCTYLAVGAISRFALVILQMQQKHGLYAMLEFLRAVLQLLLPVLAILLWRQQTFLMVSLSSSAAVLITGLIALTLARRGVVAGPARFTGRELFGLGLPLIVMALVGFGLENAERLLLQIYHHAGTVAIFATAYALARQPIDTIANAINMGAFPELVSRFDSEGPAAAGEFLAHQMALMARLCLPIAALLIAVPSEIVALLLPAAYADHTGDLFPLIALAVLGAAFTNFIFQNMMHAHKRPWLLIATMVPGSLATIGLSLLLIPSYSAMGAALALAGGSLTNLVVSIIVSTRLTPIPIPYAELLRSLGIAAAVGFAALLASAAAGETWPFIKLAAAGLASGSVFLLLTYLLHPSETRAFANQVRARLKLA